MALLYEQLNEIRKTTGWSQERISIETGLHLSTISRMFRVVGYSVNETSEILINQLYQKVIKSPFDDEIEQLFYYYDHQKEKLSQREFANYLNILEILLKKHKHIDAVDLLNCRLAWLIGHIYFDRAFYLKQKPTISLANRAIEWYQMALDILEKQQSNTLIIQKYKLYQCIVSTKFNCCEPEHRWENIELQNWFIKMEYLQLVESVIKEDKWNWIAAKNGLVAASILKDFDKCCFFWDAMKKVSKHFNNLNFKPSKDLSAIAQDQDLRWFVSELQKRGFIK